MARKQKKKTMTLGEIGFAMKVEASKCEGNVMVVDKKLWLEIAQLLMDTSSNLGQIYKELQELNKSNDNPELLEGGE